MFGMKSKKLNQKTRAALWDGVSLTALTREDILGPIVRTDGTVARVEDKREISGRVKVVLTQPSIKWGMIETPKALTDPDRDKEAFWFLMTGKDDDARFTQDGSVCKYTTSPGIAGKDPTVGCAIMKESLGLLDSAASAADWNVDFAIPMADALIAGCRDIAPASLGRRKAWLVLGSRSSLVLVADETGGAAYALKLDWGLSKMSAQGGIVKIFEDIEKSILSLLLQISPDTQIECLTIVTPPGKEYAEKWTGFALGVQETFNVDVAIFDSPPSELPERLALHGAALIPADGLMDFWSSKPSDEKRMVGLLMKTVKWSLLAISISTMFAGYESRCLKRALAEEEVAKKAASAIPDPAIEIRRFEAEANTLTERMARARLRKTEADARQPGLELPPRAAGEAMSAFSKFSADGAGLDGFSARWSTVGDPPALSALGSASSRDSAIAASLSLTRIGYGRWGSSQTGWSGKTWSFRIDEPRLTDRGASAASSGSPGTGFSPGEKAGNIASAGPTSAAQGERLPRQRPTGGLPPQTAPLKKQ